MIIRSRVVRNGVNRVAALFERPWIAFPAIPADGRILFYDRDRLDFGYLSNFFPSSFEVENVVYPHCEAYYQSQKSHREDYRRRILEKKKPAWAKYVGDSRLNDPRLSKKSWFRKHPEDLRTDWDEVKLSVMRAGLQAKFTQNRSLGKSLRATGDAEIVEDSTSDGFWGVGRDGNGKNWLGKILMELRHELA